MLSINTNLSSLIVQGNLQKSTDKLNLAIERMTTGYKINHASDNAANFSISTNMDTKIGAYMVAEENASMGLDLLMTAEGSLNLINDKLSRLRSLAVTAQNGTYGASSISALESEAEALISEIKREYATTEYNGVKLFNQQSGGSGAAAPETPATFSLARTTSFDGLERVSEADSIEANKSYRIDDAIDLVALQNFVNGGGDTTNVTFELTDDIDMDGVEFRGIGDTSSHAFKGIFNGNGYTIKNLQIKSTDSQVGLFCWINRATINCLGMVGFYIESSTQDFSSSVGALVGDMYMASLNNCWVEDGSVIGKNRCRDIGGLVGSVRYHSLLNGCYASVYVSEQSEEDDALSGGLVGDISYSDIMNCYSKGVVEGDINVGGLVGFVDQYSEITNGFSLANVNGNSECGGLVGLLGHYSGTIFLKNCYAAGNVSGSENIGGLVGKIDSQRSTNTIVNCYSLGSVTANSNGGGFIGQVQDYGCTYDDCYGNYYNDDVYYQAVGDGNFDKAEGKSFAEIQSICTPEAMGFTEDNGWMIVDGTPRLAWEFATQDSDSTPNPSPDNSGESPRPAGYVGLQVGISSSNTSTISFEINFELSGIDDILINGLADANCLTTIDNMLKTVSNKATEYGAMQNRLMSVLEEISVQYDNLVSARSTIKDADMAEVSATYIQQQILQEASATLLATANQTPALALQLL